METNQPNLVQGQVPLEELENAMDTDDHVVKLTSQTIFQKMYSMIPKEVIPVWQELGDELGLTDELGIIEADAPKKVNQACAFEMLKKWRSQYKAAATPGRLIAALEHETVNQNRYALLLKKAVDNNTFKQDYKDRKIAEDIAPYWNDVGIQLNIEHLDNIEATNSPTVHKFKGMLSTWLAQQKIPEHDIFLKFHKALVAMTMNRAAEIFYNNAFKSDNDGNGDEDSKSFTVPN